MLRKNSQHVLPATSPPPVYNNSGDGKKGVLGGENTEIRLISTLAIARNVGKLSLSWGLHPHNPFLSKPNNLT